jgi:hypothetical protein
LATRAGVASGIVAQALVSRAASRIETVAPIAWDPGDLEACGLSRTLEVMAADLELTVLYGHMVALI